MHDRLRPGNERQDFEEIPLIAQLAQARHIGHDNRAANPKAVEQRRRGGDILRPGDPRAQQFEGNRADDLLGQVGEGGDGSGERHAAEHYPPAEGNRGTPLARRELTAVVHEDHQDLKEHKGKTRTNSFAE